MGLAPDPDVADVYEEARVFDPNFQPELEDADHAEDANLAREEAAKERRGEKLPSVQPEKNQDGSNDDDSDTDDDTDDDDGNEDLDVVQTAEGGIKHTRRKPLSCVDKVQIPQYLMSCPD